MAAAAVRRGRGRRFGGRGRRLGRGTNMERTGSSRRGPANWQPWAGTPENYKLSIAELVQNNTMDAEIAGTLWAAVDEQLSFLTVAVPQNAGKTTVASAVLALRPPEVAAAFRRRRDRRAGAASAGTRAAATSSSASSAARRCPATSGASRAQRLQHPARRLLATDVATRARR